MGKIKRLNGNFSGITFKTLEKLESNGITSKDYLNDWICYSLFLRDCDKNKYDESQSREYLVKILKIIKFRTIYYFVIILKYLLINFCLLIIS